MNICIEHSLDWTYFLHYSAMPNVRQNIRIRQSVFGRIFGFGKNHYSAHPYLPVTRTIKETRRDQELANQTIQIKLEKLKT